MKLADKFTFVIENTDQPLYTATRVNNTDGYIISWQNEDGSTKPDPVYYDQDTVQNNIKRGTWRVREIVREVYAPTSNVSSVSGVTADEWTNSNFSNVTLEDLRMFTIATGWVVEIDEDFFSLTYDGATKYVVKTEAELVQAMQAVRTLVRFSDKG